MDGFQVDTDVLRRHATRVGHVAGDVGTAQSAAQTTDLNSGAFGLLCSFLPPIVAGTDQAARDAIAAVREAADAMVTELGAMARSLDEVDGAVETRFQSLARALPR